MFSFSLKKKNNKSSYTDLIWKEFADIVTSRRGRLGNEESLRKAVWCSNFRNTIHIYYILSLSSVPQGRTVCFLIIITYSQLVCAFHRGNQLLKIIFKNANCSSKLCCNTVERKKSPEILSIRIGVKWRGIKKQKLHVHYNNWSKIRKNSKDVSAAQHNAVQYARSRISTQPRTKVPTLYFLWFSPSCSCTSASST